MSYPLILNNHRLIKSGFVLESIVFVSLIAISRLKPRFNKNHHPQ
jgi:hypothetical protein